MQQKNAFTLAEVLMTLAVIGIIAALTIPMLYESITKARQTVSFKRVFAESYSAITKVALNEDCSDSLTCTHLFNGGPVDSTLEFGDTLTKTLSVSKNCGVTEDSCFSHTIRTGLKSADNKTVTQALKDANILASNASPYTFVTTRDVSYALYSLGLDCLSDSNDATVQAYKKSYAIKVNGEDDKLNPMLNVCGLVVIDINGTGSAYIWGRDVFGMWITDNQVLGLQPFGGPRDGIFNPDSTCSNNDSMGCAGRIVKDGWSMEY